MLPLPDSGVRGLKSFDAQLMLDDRGVETMISNDVFRLYFGYVKHCQRRGAQPMQFGLWLSAEKNELDDVEHPHETHESAADSAAEVQDAEFVC